MQTSKVQTTRIINELQCGSNVNQALNDSRRYDFSLILAMMSQNCMETATIGRVPDTENTLENIKSQLGIRPAPPFYGNSSTYQHAAHIAHLFHSAGMCSARLQYCLTPDALTYRLDDTKELPEEVYRNLSPHTQGYLDDDLRPSRLDFSLYDQLVIARRMDEMSHPPDEDYT